MTTRRRGAAARAILVGPVLALVATGCGDGTPEFCGPLAESADLGALSGALAADDLTAARAEAERLRDLAETAPAEIRADLAALGQAVVDIVELLDEEGQTAAPEADDEPPGVSAAQVERRRDDLNERFGDLDRRATRVSNWASQECGLELA